MKQWRARLGGGRIRIPVSGVVCKLLGRCGIHIVVDSVPGGIGHEEWVISPVPFENLGYLCNPPKDELNVRGAFLPLAV
jgi:hypothetical protein